MDDGVSRCDLPLTHERLPLGTVKTHAMRGKAKLKTWLAAWREAVGTEETKS